MDLTILLHTLKIQNGVICSDKHSLTMSCHPLTRRTTLVSGVKSLLTLRLRKLLYVKESCAMLKAILSDISDKQLYRQVEKAYDLIQSSPVKSAASVHSIEGQVINEIDNLGLAVRNGDATAISNATDRIIRLANERNRLLRLAN